MGAVIALVFLGGAVSAAVVEPDDGGGGNGALDATTTTFRAAQPNPTTTTAGAPATTAAGVAPTTTVRSATSGMTSEGSGEVASGPPVIAETGGPELLAPASLLLTASLAMRRVRLNRRRSLN